MSGSAYHTQNMTTFEFGKMMRDYSVEDVYVGSLQYLVSHFDPWSNVYDGGDVGISFQLRVWTDAQPVELKSIL